jgi:trehalose 6-phosphate phosphatase
MSRPLPLWQHLEPVLQRCRAHERCALFLDYDGTLTPIVEDPEAARLSPAVHHVLRTLVRHPRYWVAIVSGRSLADLRGRVAEEGLYLAGNHGLEIEGPSMRFDHPEGRRLSPHLKALRHALQRDLHEIAGAWVEDKGLSLSVHYRRVPEDLVPEVQERVRRRVAPAVEAGLCVLRSGKAVLEVRPHVPWHKGEAVRWILTQLRRQDPAAGVLPLYLGDDDTDEDAFRALGSEGIGIVVGRDRLHSTAPYYLPAVEDTARFLRILSAISWSESEV